MQLVPGPLGILDLQELEPCTIALRQSSLYDPPHYVSVVCRVALASTDQINTSYIWVQFSRNQLEVKNQLQQRAEIYQNSTFANHRNTKMFKSNKINQVYFQIHVEQFQFRVVNKFMHYCTMSFSFLNTIQRNSHQSFLWGELTLILE